MCSYLCRNVVTTHSKDGAFSWYQMDAACLDHLDSESEGMHGIYVIQYTHLTLHDTVLSYSVHVTLNGLGFIHNV